MNTQLPTTSIIAFFTGLVGVIIGLSLQALQIYPFEFLTQIF